MKSINYLLLFAMVVLTAACHKDPPKTYDDTDMTITYYNPEFNFSSYSTFIIPDSTVLKTNYMSEGAIETFYEDGGVSDKTLELLSQSFTGLGYTRVDSLSQADFIAVPTVMMMQSDETIWYGPAWWWGYPGYGWSIGIGIGFKNSEYYYGWWYPAYAWYPPGIPVSVSTYKGTIAFEILDAESYRDVADWEENHPEPPEPDDNPPQLEVHWQALIEGYATEDGQYNQERALRGVDEALAQSPYLNN
ncbi:MAG: DUF4136 domain-containing protein [Bacteroidota bacterium]